MSFSSKPALFALILGAAVLLFAGCMADRPQDTDLPWAAPANWEGTMGLPASFMNRYD